MNNILTIFKKEIYRVVSDPRLIFTAILLPGLAIYIMYTFLGNAIGNQIDSIEEHTIIIYTENLPDSVETYLLATGREFEFNEFDPSEFDEVKEGILSGEIDVLLRFPENFEDAIVNYDAPDTDIPEILTYFNPGENFSQNAYSVMWNALSAYRDDISNIRFGDDRYIFYNDLDNPDREIVNEEQATGQQFAQLLPMLIIMFLFSGAMSIGPDSIAGEKERGTIATLLVTPIKRSEVAIGKVISLSVIALMSATSSFIGILLSLPRLMQSEGYDNIPYQFGEYLSILGVLLATVLLIVGMVSVISAYAKTIKEASMLILPLYFVAIIVGFSTMFNNGDFTTNQVLYAVPILNSVNMLIQILTFQIQPMSFFIMVSSNLVYTVILVLIMNRLFESEKVMFSK